MFWLFHIILYSELNFRFLLVLMLKLFWFFRKLYFFHIKSKEKIISKSIHKSFRLLVPADIEQVKFVNVIDIDHLQIDPSKYSFESIFY